MRPSPASDSPHSAGERRARTPDSAGWKGYDESKTAWVDAWTQYYDAKTATNETRWARYEKSQDNVQQRRWRSATESRPSVMTGIKASPAATKVSINLSVDTNLGSATPKWAAQERYTPSPKPDRSPLPKPRRSSTAPLPRVSTPTSRPILTRTKSIPTPMKTPITPEAPMPFAVPPTPFSGTFPLAESPESARPIPIPSAASSPSGSPYLSRSAPAAPSPPRTFWASMPEDPFGETQRERELRQKQAEIEHQRDLAAARQAAEVQRERERRDAEMAEARRRALDAEIAAARRADEERLRRKNAAKAAAEQAAAEYRRLRAEVERKRDEERRLRDSDRARKEETQRQHTRDAWDRYEERWRSAASSSTTAELSFASIPWPTEWQPRSCDDITNEAIKSFILSPLHSSSKQPRQRLREQLLRFHPDRFEGRWLHRVRESDREQVRSAMNSVVRCLNEALSQCNSLL